MNAEVDRAIEMTPVMDLRIGRDNPDVVKYNVNIKTLAALAGYATPSRYAATRGLFPRNSVLDSFDL